MSEVTEMPGVVGLGGGVVGGGAVGAAEAAAPVGLTFGLNGSGNWGTAACWSTSAGQYAASAAAPTNDNPVLILSGSCNIPDGYIARAAFVQVFGGSLTSSGISSNGDLESVGSITVSRGARINLNSAEAGSGLSVSAGGTARFISVLSCTTVSNGGTFTADGVNFDLTVGTVAGGPGLFTNTGTAWIAQGGGTANIINSGTLKSGWQDATHNGTAGSCSISSLNSTGNINISVGTTDAATITAPDTTVNGYNINIVNLTAGGTPLDAYTLISAGDSLTVTGIDAAHKWPQIGFGGKTYHMGFYPNPIDDAVGAGGVPVAIEIIRNAVGLNPTISVSAADAQAGVFIDVALLGTGVPRILIAGFNGVLGNGGVVTATLPSGATVRSSTPPTSTGVWYTNPAAAPLGSDSFSVLVNDTTDPFVQGAATANVTLNFT